MRCVATETCLCYQHGGEECLHGRTIFPSKGRLRPNPAEAKPDKQTSHRVDDVEQKTKTPNPASIAKPCVESNESQGCCWWNVAKKGKEHANRESSRRVWEVKFINEEGGQKAEDKWRSEKRFCDATASCCLQSDVYKYQYIIGYCLLMRNPRASC
jgi:hypothetical protein